MPVRPRPPRGVGEDAGRLGIRHRQRIGVRLCRLHRLLARRRLCLLYTSVMGEVQRRKTVPPALLATLRMRPRSAAVARVVSPSRMGRTAPILRHRGPNRWVPAQQARTMERHALPRQHGGGLFDASCRDCARWGRACGWARDRALAGACRANVGAALAHALRELRGARCPGVRCLPAGYGAHQSGARLHAMRSSVWEPALYGMPRGRGRARPVSCRRGVRWASRTYRPCVQGRGRTAAIHRNRVHLSLIHI